MRVLITGGLGYLGGRLAQYLVLQSGYEVSLGSRRGIEALDWLPQAKVIKTQWDSSSDLERACMGADAVVHMAGMNAQDCAGDAVAALEFNGVATARLVQAAIRQGVKRFVYVSTAHVYGSPLCGVITEETCPASLHPYATSHRAGEDVVRNAHDSGKIEGIVIRLSNSFGFPVHQEANCWMLLVNDLCRQAVVERHLTIRSAGLQQRDFVTLHDVSRGILHVLNMPHATMVDGVFNLGGGRALRIIDMVEMIRSRCEQVLGFIPEISRPAPLPGEGGGMLEYRIDKLSATGFTLSGGFEAEIDATLRFCKEAFGEMTV